MEMCVCVCNAMGSDLDSALRLVFGKRGAELSIERSFASIKTEYAKANLLAPLSETLGDMDWCRQIRNQYAHTHWYYTKHEGLCFVDLETLVKRSSPIQKVTARRHSISLPLLEDQENYFGYIKQCFWNLQFEYLKWARRPIPIPPVARPSKIARPHLHS